MKKNMIKGLTLAALIVMPTVSMAETFWKTGTVERILTDTAAYGKCMLSLPVSIGNNCRSSWVSLDCSGTFSEKGDGDRLLNIALIAQTMGKSISIRVDNSKIHNGYCVATRVDILK